MTTEVSKQGISVVVPVKGRVREMRAALACLLVAVRNCPEPAEILVVDDSSPAEADEHRAHCEQYGARYLRGPFHVGAKRNLGVAHSTYDLLFFTDSDCRVPPGILQRHVATLRSAPENEAGVAGPAELETSDTRTFRIMRRSKLLNEDLERPEGQETVIWATTTNLAVRKAAFDQVGGFPSRSLTVVGGEDVDLGIRLSEAGFTIVCDPKAVVVHDRGSTDRLATVCRRLYTYGRGEQWLCTVHPRRRRFVPNVATIASAAAVAGLATARRSRGLSLLAAPLLAGAVIGLRARRLRGPDRTMRATVDSTICALVDASFDVGGFVASFQLKRPDLVLSGFQPINNK